MSPVDGGYTRSKGRKQRQNGATDVSDEILRRIYASQAVNFEDVIQLYHLDKPICQGCRGNTKDSPNCFCGLVPPPTGTRRQGLWQKISDALDELGPDPSESLRTSPNLPSGLTNLGATCYVNSVLQCLFMNTAFRNGVFAAEEDLVQRQPVLYQLSRLFAQLHSGKKSAVDSAPFASTLELDNAVQQDGQEFLKLLLTLLERVLGLSKNSRARNVVQNVFRGSFSYVTKCCNCAQESDASKEAVDFYELELNVKGFSSLYESLRNYLSEENLQGENQYMCESCKMRVDATHSTKLRSLPPVLNFQLKRFVFNAKTATKKKVTSKFTFPRSLDTGTLLRVHPSEEVPGAPAIYDLSAILVHKGSMVNSGHYVAHIKDEQSGGWWQFDDEQVTSLGSHPLGETAGAPVVKEACVENEMAAPVPDLVMDENGGEQIVHELGGNRSTSAASPRKLANIDADMLVSADAYMLMYSRRSQQGNLEQVYPSSSSSGIGDYVGEMAPGEGNCVLDSSIPERFQSEVEEMNRVFENKCLRYNQRKEEERLKISDRRSEVRRVLADVPVGKLEDPFFWISIDWLRAWADSVDPPPSIQNGHLLCQHQKISPNKIHLLKRISQAAWNYLFLKYGGGPALSGDDHCKECILGDAKVAASADNYRDQRAYMREVVDSVLNGRLELEGILYWVSRTWLMQWARRKASGAPADADSTPTAALRCPHGSLLPEQAPGAKRQLIPEAAWDYFYQIAVQVAGADPNGYGPFREDADSCSICQTEFDKVASKREGLRTTKLEQRLKHQALYAGRGVVISPSATYYLVPSLWLTRWRTYLGASGKNLLAVDEPDGLEGLIVSLLCPKHDGMLFKPPKLTRSRRGELIQCVGQEEVFTLVTSEDWTNLCLQWDVDPQRGIKAYLDSSSDWNITKDTVTGNASTVNHFGDSASKPSLVGVRDMSVEDSDAQLAGLLQAEEMDCRAEDVPALQTQPEVCQECVEEREVHEMLGKLHYASGEISVDLVVGKGPPASLLAAGPVNECERRTSKRARRASAISGGRVLLNVSGETTVFQLKLQIWESLTIVRENQRVHFGKLELQDESATLASLNILPGSQLWVMDTGQHENRDIAEELPAAESHRPETEEGFRGTRLMMGGLPTILDAPVSMEQVSAALESSDITGGDGLSMHPNDLDSISGHLHASNAANQVQDQKFASEDLKEVVESTIDQEMVDVTLKATINNEGKLPPDCSMEGEDDKLSVPAADVNMRDAPSAGPKNGGESLPQEISAELPFPLPVHNNSTVLRESSSDVSDRTLPVKPSTENGTDVKRVVETSRPNSVVQFQQTCKIEMDRESAPTDQKESPYFYPRDDFKTVL